ncbi:hypothetical protein FHR33_003581 [Nonomuraea dietziae]|uniref:Uncharacterized protein n=1 Tax=Nonomuraea dietziae TaxID=65515 RepID=A0A7W5V4I9_9ACTN|nr:hypothetical protein [Nonomuraea dietziae]
MDWALSALLRTDERGWTSGVRMNVGKDERGLRALGVGLWMDKLGWMGGAADGRAETDERGCGWTGLRE